jgi:hypothetical protein
MSSTPESIAADIAAIKAKLTAFEAKQVGWLKANWPHVASWGVGGVIFLAVKHFI